MNELKIRDRLKILHENSFVWAMRCCNQDQDLAEEALQMVYLKVLDGKAVFGGKSSFKTWLFSVIKITVLDLKRKDLLRAMRKIKYSNQHSQQDDTSEELDYRIGKFRDKIAKLPRRQQEVLELHFYHDMTLEEIAGVLRIGVGSVRQHYDRGKRKLRILLVNTSLVRDEQI